MKDYKNSVEGVNQTRKIRHKTQVFLKGKEIEKCL